MTDTFDPEMRSRIMARVHSRDTTPETAVRRALHEAGFRFRLHRRDLPGTPDIVLPRFRTAVFVHGCFWHGHGCRRDRRPSSNSDYWQEKVNRNHRRDAAALEALAKAGWKVLVIWECQVRQGIEEVLNELHKVCGTLDNHCDWSDACRGRANSAEDRATYCSSDQEPKGENSKSIKSDSPSLAETPSKSSLSDS